MDIATENKFTAMKCKIQKLCMDSEDSYIKNEHLHRKSPYNDEQLTAGFRACPTRRSVARLSLCHRQSCRAVEPRTGFWVVVRRTMKKAFFVSKKAGRCKNGTQSKRNE